MKKNEEVIHWIESYLNGQMLHEERDEFENRLKYDSDFREIVSKEQNFISLVVEYGERQKLKFQLDQFHANLPMEEYIQLYQPKPTIIYTLWKRYRVGVAIAASLVVFAFSLALHYINQEKLLGQNNQVIALRRKIDRILSSQNTLDNNLGNHYNKKSFASNSNGYGGTAFLINLKGYLLTNDHVLEGADSVFVQNRRGESFEAQIVFNDKSSDLAILKILDSTFTLREKIPYTFSKTDPELSEPVFTLGYPRDEMVFNQGYLSALTGYQGDTLNYQVSMAVNPGNSGGPILDNKGNILGILSAKQTSADGVAYAVRSSCLFTLANHHPEDSLFCALVASLRVHKGSSLNGLSRKSQIKKIQDYIYMVRTN